MTSPIPTFHGLKTNSSPGISIFGILIVIISGSYFSLTVNRKQKTEYGSNGGHGVNGAPSRHLHYLLMMGLVLLFSSPVPFLLR